MKSVGQVIGPRFVPVRDEPVEDFMTEEGELAAAWLTMSGEDSLSDPGPDDLFVGVQQVRKLSGVHHRRHFWITALIVDPFSHTV
jgi:hypothetical protein